MAHVKAKVGTETGDVAPVAGGLSPERGAEGQVRVRVWRGWPKTWRFDISQGQRELSIWVYAWESGFEVVVQGAAEVRVSEAV